MQENDKQNARVLLHIYRTISKDTSYNILKILFKNGEYNTKVLWKTTKVPQSTFFNHLDELVHTMLVDRIVHQDRSVSYKISDFGKFILEDSEDILDRIKEVFGAAPKNIETKYGGKK